MGRRPAGRRAGRSGPRRGACPPSRNGRRPRRGARWRPCGRGSGGCVRSGGRARAGSSAPSVAVAGRRSRTRVQRAGRLAGGGDGHLGRGAGRAADGRLHLAAVLAHRSLDQGQVAALHGPGGQLLDERLVGLGRAGHGEKTRGALVEPVHNARTVGRADALGHQQGQVGEAGQEPAHQGAFGVAGPRMDDEPGRLVHHGDIGVGVDDLEADTRLGRHGGVARGPHVDGELGALGQQLLARAVRARRRPAPGRRSRARPRSERETLASMETPRSTRMPAMRAGTRR